MKAKIHPKYGPVLYRCASCKQEWTGMSTKDEGKTEEIDGVPHTVISLEICSSCHPFYSGKKSFVDSAGRVDKFNRRFAGTKVMSKKAQKKAEAKAGE
ncbi:50S ribosomal protein L31 [bacterium]|nr:50S ribosomal protein L31 [bacterium]